MSLNFHSFKIVVKKLTISQTRLHYLGEWTSEAFSSCLSKELSFNCKDLVGTNGLWVENLDKMLNKLTSNLKDNEEIILILFS